jgi:hypothetical protein
MVYALALNSLFAFKSRVTLFYHIFSSDMRMLAHPNYLASMKNWDKIPFENTGFKASTSLKIRDFELLMRKRKQY